MKPEHDRPNHSPLKAQALRGVRWTSYGTAFNLLVQAAQLVVLARWLSPSELGLAALALAVAQLGVLFVDLGVGNAVVREPNLRPGVVSALWYLSLAGGVVVGSIVVLGNHGIAAFYRRHELVDLLHVVSLGLAISGIGVTQKALLQRALRFKTLVAIEAAAGIVSATVNLTLVLAFDFGPMALAWGTVARATVQSAGYTLAGRKLHPWAPPEWSGVGPFVRFGAYQLATVLLSFVGGQADTLLTGRLIGLPALGLLDTSKSLVLRPLQLTSPVVHRVMTPVLAQVQADRLRLKQGFLRSQTLLVAVNLPVFVGMALAAAPLVRVLLGSQWEAAIELVPVLALMGVARAAASAVGPLILALGLARRAFWWNVGFALSGLLAVVVGARWGAMGVATGVTVQFVALAVAQYFGHIRPFTGATISEVLRPLQPYAVAAMIASVPTLLVVAYVPIAWLALTLAAITFAGVYATWLWRTHPEARDLMQQIRGQGLLS